MMMFIALLGLASAADLSALNQCKTNLQTIKQGVDLDYFVTEDPVEQMCFIAELQLGDDMGTSDGKKNYRDIITADFMNKAETHPKSAKPLKMNDMTINWPYMQEVMSKRYTNADGSTADIDPCKDVPMKDVCDYHKSIGTCTDQLSYFKRGEIAGAGSQDAFKFEEFCNKAEADPALIGASFLTAKQKLDFSDAQANLCDNAPMKHVCDKYKEIPTCVSALSSIKQEIAVKNLDKEYNLKSPVDVMLNKCGELNYQQALKNQGDEFVQLFRAHQNNNQDMLVKHLNDMQSCNMVPMKKIRDMYNTLQICSDSGNFYDVENKRCLPCMDMYINGMKENVKQCRGDVASFLQMKL